MAVTISTVVSDKRGNLFAFGFGFFECLFITFDLSRNGSDRMDLKTSGASRVSREQRARFHFTLKESG